MTFIVVVLADRGENDVQLSGVGWEQGDLRSAVGGVGGPRRAEIY